MAILLAKEGFIPQYLKFLDTLCTAYPDETSHCQKFCHRPLHQLYIWAPKPRLDGQGYITNKEGQLLEFKIFREAPEEVFLSMMKYMTEQFEPYEKELLTETVTLDFFKHPQNNLIKHLNLASIWKTKPTKAEKQWIWEQLNVLYLIASSLKRLPPELLSHFHRLLESTTKNLIQGERKEVFKTLRENAMEILQQVGEKQFSQLMHYFFFILRVPHSPIVAFVPVQYRSYAQKFLRLLRSEKGMQLIGRTIKPLMKFANNEIPVPIKLPDESELRDGEGKMDEKKMASAFKNVFENFCSSDDAINKLVENKDNIIAKVQGKVQSLISGAQPKKASTATTKSIADDPDSSDEELDDDKKSSAIQEEEDDDNEDEQDLATELLFLLAEDNKEIESIPPPPKIQLELLLAQYERDDTKDERKQQHQQQQPYRLQLPMHQSMHSHAPSTTNPSLPQSK